MANMANMAKPAPAKAFGAPNVAMFAPETWPGDDENMATGSGAAMKHGQLAMCGERHGHKKSRKPL